MQMGRGTIRGDLTMSTHNMSGRMKEDEEEEAGDVWPDAAVSLDESTFLAGCNVYHTQSVIRQRVNLNAEAREDRRVTSPEFRAAFLNRLQRMPRFPQTQGLEDHCQRLYWQKDLLLQDVLMQAVLAVEAAIALTIRNFVPVMFAIVENRTDGVDLIWETASPKLSRRAAEIACQGVAELLWHQGVARANSPSAFDLSLEAFLETVYQKRSTNTTSLLHYAAHKRGLPVKILSREQLQIGHGCVQRLLESSMSDTTSAVAHRCCWDKRLANRRMADLFLPVPRNVKASSLKAAHEAAERLGFPVVLKPVRASGGRGITSRIATHEGIDAAYVRAKRAEQDVLVEEFVPGYDHRLLVIGGKFAGGVCRRPPTITGDGQKTVEELIDELNADPLRDGIIMAKVIYDDEVETLLTENGLTLQSVMARGMICPLRLVSNVAMGAVSEDCTDRVHEDNRKLAERAARCFFLDVAGVDMITPDISRSYREVGGQIIEINTKPGLLIHMWPAAGTPRDLASPILEQLFPSGRNGRIPVLAIAGERGTGIVARFLDQLLRECGKSTGLTLRESAFVNGEAVDLPADRKRVDPTALLSDPGVEVLVSAMSLRRIVQRGMDLDWCSVAVILDPNKEGNAEQFAAGVAVLERATAEVFIVGIGNRPALQHLDNLGRRKLILVGERIGDPMEQDHLGRGGTVIADGRVNGEDCIILMTGKRSIAHFPLGEASAQLTKGQQRRTRQVTRYAIAAAFGSGIPAAEILAALAGSSDG